MMAQLSDIHEYYYVVFKKSVRKISTKTKPGSRKTAPGQRYKHTNQPTFGLS